MKTLILSLLAVLLLAACNSKQDTSDLALNNGSKWKVNSEMKPHLDQETVILNEYIAQNKTGYATLASALKSQNEKLIKSCTMKGESHDELHKWLHPHMTLIDELSKADDAAMAQDVVAQLEESFEVYEQYFE